MDLETVGSSPTGHPTKNPLLLCNGGFFLWWGVQWDENRAAVRSTVSNQPSGLFVSARVPTIRNVYRGPALFGGVPSWLEPKITDTAAEASII